jgi:hypothetical protein
LGAITRLGEQSRLGAGGGVQKASDNAHLKSLQEQYKVIKKTSIISTKLTADELKKLKAKKLQQAIDKANVALNKGEEVFDMDKIQIAAALTNQAEQLGKATSSAQVLQIANDTARLNVKRSILALEDAIASKDEDAITAATKKLNADLGVLNALTGQNTQLVAIKSILESLNPKALIDIENLKEALRLLGQIQASSLAAPSAGGGGGGSGAFGAAVVNPAQSLIDLRATTTVGTGVNFLLKEQIDEIMAVSKSSQVDEQSKRAAMNITINAGIGSDPNAIAEAIDEYVRGAIDRGTLRAR